MKVIRLDSQDIRQLIRLRLSEANEDKPTELSDTKPEMLKQARENLALMTSSDDIGIIVSLFVILLTDKVSKGQLAVLGKKYEDHLAGGGKETDFTSAIARTMKPLIDRFLQSLEKALGVDAEDKLMLEGTEKNSRVQELYYDLEVKTNKLKKLEDYSKKHPNVKTNPKYTNAVNRLEQEIEEIKKWLEQVGEGMDTTKNKIRQNAMNRVNEMSSDPNVIRIFSMFLYFLTDPDSVGALKQSGSVYGKKLKSLVNKNSDTWTHDLVSKLRTSLNPILARLSDVVSKNIVVSNVDKPEEPDNTTKDPNEIKQDETNLQNIMKKYNIK